MSILTIQITYDPKKFQVEAVKNDIKDMLSIPEAIDNGDLIDFTFDESEHTDDFPTALAKLIKDHLDYETRNRETGLIEKPSLRALVLRRAASDIDAEIRQSYLDYAGE